MTPSLTTGVQWVVICGVVYTNLNVTYGESDMIDNEPKYITEAETFDFMTFNKVAQWIRTQPRRETPNVVTVALPPTPDTLRPPAPYILCAVNLDAPRPDGEY